MTTPPQFENDWLVVPYTDPSMDTTTPIPPLTEEQLASVSPDRYQDPESLEHAQHLLEMIRDCEVRMNGKVPA